MTEDDLNYLAGLARARSGLIMRGDRTYFVESRLGPLARRAGAPSVEGLIAQLRRGADAALVEAVVESLTVGDTAFFRDRAVFDHIGQEILPRLLWARPDGAVRVWCAGCSTGQEAYSLAMLAEEASSALPGLRLELVATDISQHALKKAQAGRYTQFEVQRGLPIRLLLKHFEKIDDDWQVSTALREQVKWRRLNLLEDRRSVRQFDLVLCRNVTSYFETETRARVLEQISRALAPDGFLILGLGEEPVSPLLDPIGPSLSIFKPNPAAARAAA